MGRTCSTYGEEENLEERGPFDRPCCRWRMILKRVFRKWDGSMD
jgi:hypothetical protein